MLLRDLKRVANECCFNPRKPTKGEKVLMDVGNPRYWVIRAMEYIRSSQDLAEGSAHYTSCIKEATKLLILSRAYLDEKDTQPRKTRNKTAKRDNADAGKA